VNGLEDWLALRDASLAEVRARLGADAAELVPDAGYGQMTGLAMVHAPGDPAIYFFADARLAVLRVEEPRIDAAELLERVGEDAPTLRSAAGKHVWVHVRAGDGLAVAEDHGRIAYVEVFPPTTFEDYERRIHQPPPAFVE
jgi:hypothetical protein